MLTGFLAKMLLLAALAYLLVSLYVFFRQRTMLYHPQTGSEAQMAELARETRMSRWLDNAGNPLGWVTSDGTGETPVLIFHGNAGNALGRQQLIEKLRDAGARGRIFVADYPGYGSAPGSPSQSSLTETATRALDAMPGRAVVVGESLGTGVAAQAARFRPDKIQGIILITPFDSMVSAAAHHYPWLPVRLLLVDRFNSEAALKTFPGPVAIVAAENDTTTPPEGARRLFESIGGPKRMWEVKSSGHNDAVANLPAQEWEKVWDFVAEGPR